MARKKNRSKIRTEFRKKHQGRARDADLTREFKTGDTERLADAHHGERVSGKGALTRHRTVFGDAIDDSNAGLNVQLDSDDALIAGRVLSVHGLQSRVMGDDGVVYSCTVRQLLKSLSTDQRHVIATGDRVAVRTADNQEGMIERVEPRSHVLSRTSRGRQHVIVANVDWLMIVTSAAEPGLKPGLIDRFLLTAEHFGITPIICINKIDLVDAAEYQQLIGTFGQLGYRVLTCSAESGQGIDFLRQVIANRETAVVGQSGVGKSSLLNVIEPGLALRVSHVSSENQKGRHTTTAAKLIPLSSGGFVVDTPGIRQFQLWDITPGEVSALMPDLRPYVSGCRYSDCLHLDEDQCQVKDAVADGRIDARRYDSYCHLLEEDLMSKGR